MNLATQKGLTPRKHMEPCTRGRTCELVTMHSMLAEPYIHSDGVLPGIGYSAGPSCRLKIHQCTIPSAMPLFSLLSNFHSPWGMLHMNHIAAKTRLKTLDWQEWNQFYVFSKIVFPPFSWFPKSKLTLKGKKRSYCQTSSYLLNCRCLIYAVFHNF